MIGFAGCFDNDPSGPATPTPTPEPTPTVIKDNVPVNLSWTTKCGPLFFCEYVDFWIPKVDNKVNLSVTGPVNANLEMRVRNPSWVLVAEATGGNRSVAFNPGMEGNHHLRIRVTNTVSGTYYLHIVQDP